MQSSRRNILLLGMSIVIASTLQSISSITPPPLLLPRTIINRRPSYRIGGEVHLIRRISKSRRNDIEEGTTQQQLNAISYLNSLNDITSNPQLFPTTSSYIKTLSAQKNRQQDQSLEDADAAAIPSAEEFLTQLSNELLRASQQQQQQNDNAMHQHKQQHKLDVSPVASSSTFTFPGSGHSKQSSSNDTNNNDSTTTTFASYNTNNNDKKKQKQKCITTCNRFPPSEL